MSERVQQVLDGEVPREVLDAEESAELARMESMIGAVLRVVPERAVPDLAPAVLAKIEKLDIGAIAPETEIENEEAKAGDWLSWIWRPRRITIAYRPAYALGLFAATVLAGVRFGWPEGFDFRGPASGSALPVQAPPAPRVLVQFRLDLAEANSVALAGDFTGWQPSLSMTRVEPGIWTVVVPLTPGIHEYAFVVDGERWIPDPLAPAVADGFGGYNSRLAVLKPDPEPSS